MGALLRVTWGRFICKRIFLCKGSVMTATDANLRRPDSGKGDYVGNHQQFQGNGYSRHCLTCNQHRPQTMPGWRKVRFGWRCPHCEATRAAAKAVEVQA